MALLAVAKSSPYTALLIFSAAPGETATLVKSGPGDVTLAQLAVGPLRTFLTRADWFNGALNSNPKFLCTHLISPGGVDDFSLTPLANVANGPRLGVSDANTITFSNTGTAGQLAVFIELRFIHSLAR